MGVIINKENSDKNELSRRIDADLRAKAMAMADAEDGSGPGFAEDSEYLRDTKKTGRFGWVWLVLIVMAVLSVILIVFI